MKDANVKATELTSELIDALDEAKQNAFQFLKLTGEETPPEVVKMIYEAVNRLLEEQHSSEDLQEYAIQLGTLWGFMVEKEYGWQWRQLDFLDDDVQGIYLVSPRLYYCCPPLYFLNKIIQGNNAGLDDQNDNTVMLLFNMLKDVEKRLPDHTYQFIS